MAITPKSGIRVLRRGIRGMEGMFTKMWDPPRESPPTPDRLDVPNMSTAPGANPRANPVPAFMASLPGLGAPSITNTVRRTLIAAMPRIPTWDGVKSIAFMMFNDPDFFNAGSWPAPTIRVPRGTIFHGETQGKGPPPHTIHWHGIEPTPMNDGVGHCSMEIGQYTYQWQPNFIGTYFYHCHRNTVQHFEFGLYGMVIIEPPDAFDGPNAGGYPRRTAANLINFPQFPEFVAGDLTFGLTGPFGVGVGDPHAFTVPYDVEALWVLDDRDSAWSDLADSAKAFYPGGANTNDGLAAGAPAVLQPGTDDQFAQGFFNDFNADYWFVTGVPVQASRGGTGIIEPAAPLPRGGVGGIDINPGGTNPLGLIPPALNSGVSGMQIAINAQRGQTVLVRCLDAAYNSATVTFPIDAVIIAWDGRALGVPPFSRYNHAFLLPAGTPMRISTARRFDALLRVPTTAPAVNDFATVRFIDTRGENVLPDNVLVTARIPINID